MPKKPHLLVLPKSPGQISSFPRRGCHQLLAWGALQIWGTAHLASISAFRFLTLDLCVTVSQMRGKKGILFWLVDFTGEPGNWGLMLIPA